LRGSRLVSCFCLSFFNCVVVVYLRDVLWRKRERERERERERITAFLLGVGFGGSRAACVSYSFARVGARRRFPRGVRLVALVGDCGMTAVGLSLNTEQSLMIDYESREIGQGVLT
jgi:hypothetical protein